VLLLGRCDRSYWRPCVARVGKGDGPALTTGPSALGGPGLTPREARPCCRSCKMWPATPTRDGPRRMRRKKRTPRCRCSAPVPTRPGVEETVVLGAHAHRGVGEPALRAGLPLPGLARCAGRRLGARLAPGPRAGRGVATPGVLGGPAAPLGAVLRAAPHGGRVEVGPTVGAGHVPPCQAGRAGS